MQVKATKQATGQEIRKILGPADDEVVRAIQDIGASPMEVLQAFEWLEDDNFMGKNLKKPMASKTRRVYELLVEDRDEAGPDAR